MIAPDQRGYGLTDRPEPVEAYDIEHLTDDLVRLLDHLKIEKAIFAGHDWGGIVVWQMPLRHPDRTAGVIGLNTPFMPRAPRTRSRCMRRRLGRGDVHRPLPEARRGRRGAGAPIGKTMELLPAPPLPGTGEVRAGLATERKEGDPSVFALVNILKAYDPTFDPREKFLTDDELDVFVETFKRTGFTGGINWYRNFTRNWERSPRACRTRSTSHRS